MSKKTALDRACENLHYIFYQEDSCANCFAKKLFNEDGICDGVPSCSMERETKDCVSIMKKYFKQQADILDGGEVVEKICEIINNEIANTEDCINSFNDAGMDCQSAYQYVDYLLRLQEQLQQAGIEVD